MSMKSNCAAAGSHSGLVARAAKTKHPAIRIVPFRPAASALLLSPGPSYRVVWRPQIPAYVSKDRWERAIHRGRFIEANPGTDVLVTRFQGIYVSVAALAATASWTTSLTAKATCSPCANK